MVKRSSPSSGEGEPARKVLRRLIPTAIVNLFGRGGCFSYRMSAPSSYKVLALKTD